MTIPNPSAPTSYNPTADKTNQSIGPAGNNTVIDKTNPFVGLDVSGFEPIEVTVAKKKVKAGEKKKSARRPPTVSEHRTPLAAGESLYDSRIDPIRFHNIVGG
jgi:hypothetical protein